MTKRLSRTQRTLAGAGLALGSLGIAGVGLALADGGTAAAASNGSSSGAAATTHPVRYLRRHTVDATITLKTKNGYKTVQLARGTIESISSTSITVDSPDGTSLTGTITSATKFHNTTEGQLAQGDKVGLWTSAGDALLVNAPKAASSTTTAPSTSS